MFLKIKKLSKDLAIVITKPNSEGYYTFGYCQKSDNNYEFFSNFKSSDLSIVSKAFEKEIKRIKENKND